MLCSLLACGQACALGCKFSMAAFLFSSPLSNNGAFSLLQVQTFSWIPSVTASHSPALSIFLPSPLGCLHTANPSPLPMTDLQSLNFSAQPPPEHLRLWCLCQWFGWSVCLSLCFLVLRPAPLLFSASQRSLWLGWSFCQLGGFLGCGFLFSFTAPSWEC